MNLAIVRDVMASTHCFGLFSAANETFQTIEMPWIPSADHPGGTNGISCVPYGTYALALQPIWTSA